MLHTVATENVGAGLHQTTLSSACSSALHMADLRTLLGLKEQACNMSSEGNRTALKIDNCRALVHFGRRLPTITSTSDFVGTLRSANKYGILLVLLNDDL